MNQTFQVQGMSCGHCVGAVTQAVKTVDPQAEVKVDLASGKVEVQSQQDARRDRPRDRGRRLQGRRVKLAAPPGR
jgi:copper chaperone